MDRAAMAALAQLDGVPQLLAYVPATHRDAVLDRGVTWLDARRDFFGYGPGGGTSLAASNGLFACMEAAEKALIETLRVAGFARFDAADWAIELGVVWDRAAGITNTPAT